MEYKIVSKAVRWARLSLDEVARLAARLMVIR